MPEFLFKYDHFGLKVKKKKIIGPVLGARLCAKYFICMI